MANVTAQMSVSLDGFFSGPDHVDAGFHRVTRWAIDAFAWRDRLGFEGGLLDQLDLHISPVLIGEGMRLFGPLDHDALELTPVRVVDTPDVTHVRYRINGPSKLVIDNRGAGPAVEANDHA